MELGSLLLALIYGLWLCFTIVYQFPGRAQAWLGRWDFLGLLPSWSFFAPNPGTTDYRLVYCDSTAAGLQAEWKEVLIYSPKPWRLVWNPSKHASKAFTDICQSLFATQDAIGDDVSKLQLTWPYMAILGFVVKQPVQVDFTRRQFAILATRGHEEPREIVPLFVSALHRL